MKKGALIPVRLGDRSYEVHIREGLLDEIHLFLQALPRKPDRIALVVDSNVDRHYGDRVIRSLTRFEAKVAKIEIEPGESSKSLQGLGDLYEAFADAGLDRGSLAVAFGGGVLGDLAGFAAATYLRGIPWLHVPTTLLAQVDASVGGKTGINLPWGKNLAGAFHQPLGVLIDPELLSTLPAKDFRSGLAEIVKVASACDAKLFDYLETHREAVLTLDPKALLHVIARAVEIKAALVEEDERERGRRMLLNFGHTIGHAIEAAKGYQGVTHGEAVAIGMAAAAILSSERGLLKPSDRDRLLRLLRNLHQPTQLPAATDLEDLFDAMAHDKKRRSGAVRFVLLERIGKGKVVEGIEPATVRKILAILR